MAPSVVAERHKTTIPTIQMVMEVDSNEKERETLVDFFVNKAKDMSNRLVIIVTIPKKLKRIMIIYSTAKTAGNWCGSMVSYCVIRT
jgi:hypothetical protein